MTAEEVVDVVDHLESAGMTVWLEGGWGVDALLERQTRPHDDLDLVVALEDVLRLQQMLEQRGYRMLGGSPPMSFELVDNVGRQLDVHPVTFDESGDGIYQMRTGGTWAYPAHGFAGRGKVAGRNVRCLTPEAQVISHADHVLSDYERADLRALHEQLGVDNGKV